MHETVRVGLYGVVAAASPLVLVAALVVLASGRGRVNGVVFAAAFLLGQCAAYLVAFAVGAAVTRDDSRSHHVLAVLELALGILLVGFGVRRRVRRSAKPSRSTPRTEALFTMLADVKPVASFGVGMPLGVGAKRLTITFLAATTVAAAALSRASDVALSALYVMVASSVVWVPVGLYLVFGERADGLVADLRRWIVDHEESLAVASALAFGVLLVADAMVALLT